jgi:integrase
MQPEFRFIRWRGKFAVEWYDETGRRFRRSLGTDQRGEAKRRLTEEFIPAFHKASRPREITVAYAWELYRSSLGAKPASVTMGHEWKAISAHFGELLASNISEDDCRSYIRTRRETGRKDGTIWTELGHLRSALRHAAEKNLIDKAPKIYRPERPAPRDKRMTRAEALRFLDACGFPHIRLFAILAITTAARSGALLGLTWDRVDLEAGLIHLGDPSRARTNKGRALVPMNATARAALAESYKGRTSAFVIEWAGERVVSVKKGIGSTAARAGLPWVTAHVFRHSAACFMAEDGVPMAEIAQYLGHSDSRLTEKVYARFSPTHLRKAAGALEFDLVRPVKTDRA